MTKVFSPRGCALFSGVNLEHGRWNSARRLHHWRHKTATSQPEFEAEKLMVKYTSLQTVLAVRDDLDSDRHTGEYLRIQDSVQNKTLLEGTKIKTTQKGSYRIEKNVEVGNKALTWSQAQLVEASFQKLWEVLLTYEGMGAFISNLIRRDILTRPPNPEQIWLLQKCDQLYSKYYSERRLLLLGDDSSLNRKDHGRSFKRLDGMGIEPQLDSLNIEASCQEAGSRSSSYGLSKDMEVESGAVNLKERDMVRNCVEASSQKNLSTYERLVEFISQLVRRDKTMNPCPEQKGLLHKGFNIPLYWQLLDPTSLEQYPNSVVYEDLQVKFSAVRDKLRIHLNNCSCMKNPTLQVTTNSRAEQTPLASRSTSSRKPSEVHGKRIRVEGLQRDFKVLEKELFAFILEHGQEGFMPMRSELRQLRRIDLEKAITRMGGFSNIATRLNLSQHRRPRGYWDNFQNLRQQILLFQMESGLDNAFMPTRNSLNKGGRPDVARALEKWGGVQQVAQMMGLKVHRVRPTPPSKVISMDVVTNKDKGATPQKPLKISLPAKPRKWLDMKQVMRSDKRIS